MDLIEVREDEEGNLSVQRFERGSIPSRPVGGLTREEAIEDLLAIEERVRVAWFTAAGRSVTLPRDLKTAANERGQNPRRLWQDEHEED